MYIVQGEQAEAEYLVGDVEVPDIGAGEARAGGTVAGGVQGARIGPEFSALYVQPPFMGEDRAVPSHARRRDAIEQIDAAANALDEIFREAHAHEVSRACAGKSVVVHFEHLVHRQLLFADGQPANRISGPVMHSS